MLGRTTRVNDLDLAPGAVDHPLIDEKRRLVLGGVELLPRSIGRATKPLIGRLELAAGQKKELSKASWENGEGAVAEADLPSFLSWSIQIKSGSARLKARENGENRWDIPNVPGAFSETEGASVAGWFAEETTGSDPAVLQILATVLT